LNPFLLTFVYFIVTIIIVGMALILFELITTKYKDWDEIGKGNAAVAMSVGGKIVAICIILSFSIYTNDSVFTTALWGGYGVVLQLIAYYLFDFMTRTFSVEEKLKEGNISVGIISMCVSIGLAFVIGASIT
jgi:putative membrane protein